MGDAIKIAFYERSIGKLTLPVKEKRNSIQKVIAVIFRIVRMERRIDLLTRIQDYLQNTNAGNDRAPAFNGFCLEVSAGSA